ncbi:hypothetical protein C1637_05190 [Chryseobacterium lactis]|uniref:TonB-dependent receptor plug domain-containing protein n=1 Tax=Chryseobacterium lactis TaxID=1241981 RepID=A0A3G6RN71_CHRLC|nr:hypothetical protein [Chryseobacterium lactis]AZA84241.1 hypothetical protein EG342_21160 [Chryseobacterium lactis]AZB04629.1 hypothetical protein EG341_12040 [Chryseobacterium lactis]PNW14360.1 hypothetical protein C1637_05190 [Chryseobacterium lactis]
MKITIPKPCHENWGNMTIDEQGKFCAVCSKTIYDFTNFSDEELVNSLGQAENICGRFRNDQLGRNLNFSLTGKIALGLLAAGGALTTVSGQELKGEEVKKMDFKKGIDGVEVINKTLHKTMWLGMPTKEDIESTQPVILLDGKRISEEKMKKIDGDKVRSIKVLSGEGAVKLYGKLGENGIIIIESKK